MIFRILMILCLSFTLCYGNPYLVSEPIEELIDYYVISIDGEEVTSKPSFDMMFIYSLKDLEDGKHTILLSNGSVKWGEGPPVMFYLIKETGIHYTDYTIEPDPVHMKDDPEYLSRFIEPQTVRVENKPDDGGGSGGGGGGGCFISTVGRKD